MNRTVAFVLTTAGTVGAAIGVAQTDPSSVGFTSTFQWNIPLTGVSLIVLLVGILVTRAAARVEREAGAEGGADLGMLRSAATDLANQVQAVEDDLDSLDVSALHHRIDAIAVGPSADFDENCRALADAFGMSAYARVMAIYAPAERTMNRAWSASADGYPEEACACVRRAAPVLREVNQMVTGL